jgi:hypothetical protein
LYRRGHGTALLIDIDKDGRHEVEMRGSYGTGPNCEGTVFRLNEGSTAMTPFYRGGYFSPTMIDRYLVESGRASCCAWESHGYKVRPGAEQVAEEDLEYRIDVAAEAAKTACLSPWSAPSAVARRRGLGLIRSGIALRTRKSGPSKQADPNQPQRSATPSSIDRIATSQRLLR